MTRILRLTGAEIEKILLLRFFWISLSLLILIIPLWADLQPHLTGREATPWRGRHAVELFACGAKPGITMATLLILIFTSLLFAGEFDRGTIRLLLTRPVLRRDVFLSKALAAILLSLFLTLLALLVSAAQALLFGDLGPVWDDHAYIVSSSGEAIRDHALRAVSLSLLPAVSAAFLGLFLSNITEHSGYAVASTLVVYIVLDLAVGFLRPTDALWFFNHPPRYAFDTLRQFAEGSSTFWLHVREGSRLHWIVPLLSSALFGSGAFLIFRSRDITA